MATQFSEDPGPDERLPLPALLSRALVAFTIEFDNEFEHQMPHRTTLQGALAGAGRGPWLVSLVMWSNCMQFVGPDGVTVRELERLARTPTNLPGMQRWGYIVVAPDAADSRPKGPPADWRVRATPAGQAAQAVWRPLFGTIEQRWRERFGSEPIDTLRACLAALASQSEVELPDCLPILGYGLASKAPGRERPAPGASERAGSANLPLPALLSKVLLAFTLDFERESELSLAISADVLRVAGGDGVRVRDLPRLAAVSKEAIAMAVKFLEKRGYATVGPEMPGSRVKRLALTARGRQAQAAYQQLVWAIEDRWQSRFGQPAVARLRAALERLAGGPAGEAALLGALVPYPDGWRAAVPRPAALPHYPMVLHRGGFPDGS